MSWPSREVPGNPREFPRNSQDSWEMLGNAWNSFKIKLDTVGRGVNLGTIAKVDIVGVVDDFSKNGAE